MICYLSYKIGWIKIFFRDFSQTFSKKFLISLTVTYHLTNSLTFPDFPDRVETLKIKYCLKEATVLYFTRYSCVVFYFVRYGFIQICIFYRFFWKTSFCLSVLFVFCLFCVEFDVTPKNFITFKSLLFI